MSTQMTIRIDDDLAAFVDRLVQRGEGSRAKIINHALAREMRRRAVARDAMIYAAVQDPDLDSDSYTAWASEQAAVVATELD